MSNENASAWESYDNWLDGNTGGTMRPATYPTEQQEPTEAQRAANYKRAVEIRREAIQYHLPDDHPYVRKHGRIHPNDR